MRSCAAPRRLEDVSLPPDGPHPGEGAAAAPGERARGWRRLAALTALAALLAAAAPPARADDAPGLHVDPLVDGVVTGGALMLAGAAELAAGRLAPPRCRWCEPPGLDRSVRDALRWGDPGAAGTSSDVLLGALFLAGGTYDLASAGATARAAEDVLVVGEAVAVTLLLTEAAKYTFARERPYAWADPAAIAPGSSEAVVSFWSGHVSTAFALAAAGGSVARLRGYPGWRWVYGAGFAGAAGVAYLRIAADQHWASDVLVGAALGTAVGFAVPWLHRGGDPSALALAPWPGGVAIAGRF